MTKNRSTKSALLMSVLALFLCVVMLMGTTFAWFTDSVTSAGNVIMAGTLDVDLVDEAGQSMAGEIIEFVAADGRAQNAILWEPGCTYKTEPVYVVNKGNLDLNWKLGINGITGDAKLLEAIEWTVTVDGVETALDALNGTLLANAKTGAIILKGHMKETAGNEYQGLIAEGVAITVFATQVTSEKDSFNDQYDAMATIDTVDELNVALAADYDLITLGANIELTETLEIPADKTVAIDLGGYKISGTDTAALYSLIHVANGGNLTVMDSVGTGKISYDAGAGKTGTAVWVEGALVLESGTIEITGEWNIGFGVDLRPNAWGTAYAEDATFVMNGGAIVASDSGVRVNINSSAAYEDTAVFTMNGGRISAAYDAIFAQHNYAGNAQVIVNNGAVTSANTHAVRIYGTVSTDIDVTINGGNFIGRLTNFDNGDVVVSGGTYSDLSVLNYLADGADVTIKLAADVAMSSPVTVPASATVTLDLNGKKLSYDSTTQNESMITNKGTMTINDSVGGGEIYYNYTGAADPTFSKGNNTISNRGMLTVNGGKIYLANLSRHAKFSIDNNSTTGDAVLVINGGHLYNYNMGAIRMFCNSTTYKNSVTVNGGLVEGYNAIWMQNPNNKTVNGQLTITGGEIRSTAKAYVNGTSALKDVSSALYCSTAGGAWSTDSFVSITGGTINENVSLKEEAPANITCNGATFNGYVEKP